LAAVKRGHDWTILRLNIPLAHTLPPVCRNAAESRLELAQLIRPPLPAFLNIPAGHGVARRPRQDMRALECALYSTARAKLRSSSFLGDARLSRGNAHHRDEGRRAVAYYFSTDPFKR
jgi:hypothetical protein